MGDLIDLHPAPSPEPEEAGEAHIMIDRVDGGDVWVYDWAIETHSLPDIPMHIIARAVKDAANTLFESCNCDECKSQPKPRGEE